MKMFSIHTCKGDYGNHKVPPFLYSSVSTLFLLLSFLFLLFPVGCSAPSRAQFAPEVAAVGDIKMTARTGERLFEVYRDGQWQPMLVKGVNIGTALPGHYFTWFPGDRDVYRGWLEDTAALNANVIRLYTLLDPLFYREFLEYNMSVPLEKRIWLLQEIWPEEEVPDDDYFNREYMEEYKEEIRNVVNALHGAADIPGRRGRAYGNYSADVSPYILGMLIGRELEPHEVLQTDDLNREQDMFDGLYVQAKQGSSATEVWLALMCDYTLEYASQNYGWQYPVSFVSWPTLDPLDHPSEWEPLTEPYNDMAEVNPAHLQKGPENIAGLFGSYHIYPNYPDFMNNEPSYDEYRDGEGILRYGAYLREFMAVHPPYPVLVAEFGMATGLSTAHIHPHGFHHGGVDERQQGEMTARMMDAIIAEGYAGGVIFALMDEWVKKTWSTEPYMIPYERNVFWQNALCPEQNYGLVAMEPAKEPFQEDVFVYEQDVGSDSFSLTGLHVDHNEAFFFLGIEISGDYAAPADAVAGLPDLPEGMGLLLGISTLGPDRGNIALPLAGESSPHGLELILMLTGDGDDGLLLATSSYNRAELRFASPVTTLLSQAEGEMWETIRPVVNRERLGEDGTVFPELRTNQSMLPRGNFYAGAPGYDSMAMVYSNEEAKRIEVRLPWALLNFSDPSNRRAMDDSGEFREPPLRDTLQTVVSPGISLCAVLFRYEKDNNTWPVDPESEGIFPGDLSGNPLDHLPRQERGTGFAGELPFYTWEIWEEPSYKARYKESFEIVSTYFSKIP